MVGITLSPEQIRQAPPEVRRWLSAQIASTLGLYEGESLPQPPERHLVACTLEEARAVLSLIQGHLAVVNVFFELSRDPVAVLPQGIRVLRLEDMLRHSRLTALDQLLASLEILNNAVQRVRGEPEATLTAVHNEGYCLVADVTARSISILWEEFLGTHERARRELASPMPNSPAGAAVFPSQPPGEGLRSPSSPLANPEASLGSFD
ncbi:MAG: hypothetical protein K6U10_02935 [Acidobacteriia bacterium]|nr:hypothetical protein [Methyloceanibacter sp.]MBX5472841.1 hypothetical protein [Acetobacteraceae bacterium]MCL6490757.1 hypothetical protein [Terriglobia bacterium]